MTDETVSHEKRSATKITQASSGLDNRPATMVAVTQHGYGSTDTLSLKDVPLPDVGERDVLIEVVAAGLDRGVWHLMTGVPYLVRLAGDGFLKPKNPIPGSHVAGRVVATGSTVQRFAVGDEVMGIAKGSFAEYAVADQKTAAGSPGSAVVVDAVVWVRGFGSLGCVVERGGVAVFECGD